MTSLADRGPGAVPSGPRRIQSGGEEASLGPEHILFVCTANVDRSRTAHELYDGDPRYEVLSAGTAPFAMTPLSRQLLLWADRVFVMCEREDKHRTLIKMRFPDVDRPVIDLDIQDRWRRGHPELVRRLLKKLEPHLGPPPPGNVARMKAVETGR